MSIPLSNVVEVNIAVSPTLDPLAGFGELLFLTDDPEDLKIIGTAERQRKFGGLKEVESAYASYTKSHVVKAAKSFYAQTPQPKDFTVGVMAVAASAGALVGGVIADIDVIKAIPAVADSKFILAIDDKSYEVEYPAFDTVTSYANLASSLQTQLLAATEVVASVAEGSDFSGVRASPVGVTCVYTGGKLVITSGTEGVDSLVGYPVDKTPNVNNPLQLLGLSSDVAYSSVMGTGVESVSAALGACDNISSTFVGVVLHANLRDKEANISGSDGAASWCEAAKKIFLNTTGDFNVQSGIKAQLESTEAFKLKNKSYSKTITTFTRNLEEYPSASLFGRIATVNYEGSNTTITLKFKKLPGISALNSTTAQKKSMDSLNVGGFISVGGNLMYAESRMADNGWLDAVHGLMWLEDRIKKGVFNLMYGTTTKIPYTDTGINMVVQKVTSALEQAKTNGLVAAGNTPEGVFLPEGYVITAASSTQVAAEDKSNRIYRGITFQCVGAGALHNVVISGSFSE